jgi:hypothetical protein
MPLATSKPVEVVYFPLTSAADCAAALDAALNLGFRGAVSAWTDGGVEVWAIELSGGPLDQRAVMVSDGDTARLPTVGDVFVWGGNRLTAFSADGFSAAYTPL